MSKTNTALTTNLTHRQSDKALKILSAKYPEHSFYRMVWGANDTNYVYTVFVEGRGNSEMRAYAAGVADAVKALVF